MVRITLKFENQRKGSKDEEKDYTGLLEWLWFC
jgi:hypothetical protein